MATFGRGEPGSAGRRGCSTTTAPPTWPCSTTSRSKARSIAAQYLDHPVDRWRNAFAAIINQLDELEGKGPQVADADNRDQQQAEAGGHGAELRVRVGGQERLSLTWQNLEAVRVNYYLMDVELLFSRNPFVQQCGSQFAQIRPNATREVKLPAAQDKQSIPLPDDLADRNVLVEVIGRRQDPVAAVLRHRHGREAHGELRPGAGRRCRRASRCRRCT